MLKRKPTDFYVNSGLKTRYKYDASRFYRRFQSNSKVLTEIIND